VKDNRISSFKFPSQKLKAYHLGKKVVPIMVVRKHGVTMNLVWPDQKKIKDKKEDNRQCGCFESFDDKVEERADKV